MKKTLRALALLLTLSLCGCQPAPQRDMEWSSKGTSVLGGESQIKSSMEYNDNSSTIIEADKTKIPETPAHVDITATAGEITLVINADVAASNCDVLHIYDFHARSGVSEDLAKSMASVMGEVKSLEADGSYSYEFCLAARPDELYTIEAPTNKLSLFGHTDNLCPYGENIHADQNAEILTNFTRENAKEKCLEMCRKIYDGDSVVLDMFTFGATIGLDYYKITAAPVIDNIPVISDKTRVTIDVSEKGINMVEAYRFKAENGRIIEEILPLSECVETAAEKAALLMIFPNRADYNCYNYQRNEDGKLTNINIEKIELAYIVEQDLSGTYSLYPAWVFVAGTNGILDHRCGFAVNAVTGEVSQI